MLVWWFISDIYGSFNLNIMQFSWEFIIYASVILMISIIVVIYVIKLVRETKISTDKIEIAKKEGVHEPVSLYPVIDPDRCIRSGACVKACPEHDILGIRNGRGTIINASQCIGHGACFRSCPTQAISLWIGTEKRGVDLPEVFPNFETNVPGIFIAGELGGMGLIKNAITQGKQAAENIAAQVKKDLSAQYDLIIVGAGPAGISASLAAKKAGLKVVILEQDTLGGTVFTFPRSKVIMTSPVELPLYGKIKFRETSKTELLEIWKDVIQKHQIEIIEKTKVEEIDKKEHIFELKTDSKTFTSQNVLLAIGRRGTPRKLHVPGETLEKVAYRLLEPELIQGKKVIVVGGGDSAVESALLLAEQNDVILSYRSDKFSRIKPKNAEKIMQAIEDKKLKVLFNTVVKQIDKDKISIHHLITDELADYQNDLIYILAGGELPTEFLKKAGINISTKRGEVFMSHSH